MTKKIIMHLGLSMFFLFLFSAFTPMSEALGSEEGCAYRSHSRTLDRLPASDEDACVRNCARVLFESGDAEANCTYEGKSLPFSDLKPCGLFDETGRSILLSTFDFPWTSTVKKEVCRANCKKKMLPEFKEDCYWGEDALIRETDGEQKICRVINSRMDEGIPFFPALKQECIERTRYFMAVDLLENRRCRFPLVRWGNEILFNQRQDLEDCTPCMGTPWICSSSCTTKDECLKNDSQLSRFKLTWGQGTLKNRVSQKIAIGRSCALQNGSGRRVWEDAAVDGHPEECRLACVKKIERFAHDKLDHSTVVSNSGLSCIFFDKTLFQDPRPCFSDRYNGTIYLGVVSKKQKISRILFKKNPSNNWESFNYGHCEVERASHSEFVFTQGARSWGKAKWLDIVPSSGKNSILDAQKVPKEVRINPLVVSNFSGPFSDPLELKSAKVEDDISFIEKDLVDQKTFIVSAGKERQKFFSPLKGPWLRLEKSYRGKDGILLHLSILPQPTAKLTLAATDKPLFHGIWVIRRNGKTTLLNLGDEAMEFIGSGDWNGDGKSEWLFLNNGNEEIGVAYLVDPMGAILAISRWGEWGDIGLDLI